MKQFLLLIVALMGAELSASKPDKSPILPQQEAPTIRVLIEENCSSALVEVKGPYAVMDLHKKEKLSSGRVGKRYPLFMIDEALRWGEEYPDVFAITIEPKSERTSIYVNGIQYRGSLSIYGREDGKMALVNEVSIENFVNSVLSGESSRPSSKEALAALAIQARTWAYQAVLEGKAKGWLWDTYKEVAGYTGNGLTAHREVQAAVIDTAHIVVTEGSAPKNIQIAFDKAEELASKW